MFKALLRIWQLPDLRRRILILLGLLAVVRVLAHLPLPGIDLVTLRQFFANNQIFGLLDLFSGGSLSNFSVAMLGVGPYITASIIMQLLTVVIPSLEALQKEGEFGRQKINQYTRYLTIPLAFISGYGTLILLKNQGAIQSFGGLQLATMLVAITAGTILMMWLGELISENGIGNGISIIISVGIIAGFPTQIRNTLAPSVLGGVDIAQLLRIAGIAVAGVAAVALITFMTEAERRIPVTYARRTATSATGVQSHLPIRINAAGVIPIIFALSMLLFPNVVAQFLSLAKTKWLANGAQQVADFLNNQTYYAIFYFVLVVLFTFFYTAIVFKPVDVAENLQKRGGFIPGIRPGAETKTYLSYVINRTTMVGSLFLAGIAVLPFIGQALSGITTLVLGGTSILILVSVVIETQRQIKAQLQMRTYDHFA